MAGFINRNTSVNYHEKFTSTLGQTTVTLDNSYDVGKNQLQVYVENVRQFVGDDYTETSSNSFTFTESLEAGLEIQVDINK